MEAYIFINSEPRRVWDIAEAALKIKEVKKAHAVTGQFDVVIYVEFSNMNILEEIITKIHSLLGVKQTRTAVAMPHRIEPESP